MLVILGLSSGACTGALVPGAGSRPAAPSAASSQGSLVPGAPRWQSRSGLSVPRDDFATAVVDKEIWAFGGMSGDRGTRLDSIEIYDTRSGDWRVSEQTMPEGLASFEGAAVGKDVFLFGGLDATSRASDFSAVLDTSTGKWQKLPPLPTPRYAHTVTLHEGLIYVIGGEGAHGPVETVDVFDPSTRSWSTGAPMPKARGSHDAVAVDEEIYVLGGWLNSGPTDLVQTYDPVADEWAPAEPLPEPVSRAGAALLDGRLWVSRHQFSSVLDIDEGTWSPANPLPVSRHGLGYVAVGSSVYAVGGCTESPLRDVRTVDAFEAG